MIFGLWVIGWTQMSKSVAMLLLPALAVVIRGAYLDRPVTKTFRFAPAFVATLSFAWLLLMDKSIEAALLQALQIFLSSFVLVHLMFGFQALYASIVSEWLSNLFVVSQRCFPLVWARLTDVWYAFRSRWRNRRGDLRDTLWLLAALIVAGANELLQLGSEIDRLLLSRGGVHPTRRWAVPTKRQSWIALGDLAMLGIVIVVNKAHGDGLIPSELLNLISLE